MADTKLNGSEIAKVTTSAFDEDFSYSSYIHSATLESVVEGWVGSLHPIAIQLAKIGLLESVLSCSGFAAERRRSLVTRACDALSADVLDVDADKAERLLADLSAAVVPCTDLADECFFIRCIQSFEILFVEWRRRLRLAMWEARRNNPVASGQYLASTCDSINASLPLMAALSTISIENFGRIRESTTGASAIASEGYPAFVRTLELARQLAIHPDLDCIVEEHKKYMRVHISVARQLIGDKSGTGGTEGVKYLEESMNTQMAPPGSKPPVGACPF